MKPIVADGNGEEFPTSRPLHPPAAAQLIELLVIRTPCAAPNSEYSVNQSIGVPSLQHMSRATPESLSRCRRIAALLGTTVGIVTTVLLSACGGSLSSSPTSVTTRDVAGASTSTSAAETLPITLPTPTAPIQEASSCTSDHIALAAGVSAASVRALQCNGGWAIADICEDPEDCVDATKIFRFDGSAWVLATYLLGNGQRCLDTFAGVGAPTDVAQSFCETSSSSDTASVSGAVLGQPWASNQQGYGEVAPSVVFNGGSGLGMIQDIAWESWGGPEARGTGMAIRPGASGGGADGSLETATIVAFDLGTCPGSDAPAYTGVTWFFPADGSWEVGQGEWTNACSGDTLVGE